LALCAFDVEGGRMLVSDCCAMISETRDSVTDETVALIPVVEHLIGPACDPKQSLPALTAR
jgi:hypothetical protein